VVYNSATGIIEIDDESSVNHALGANQTMRIALFEPDIPQNAGAILRLGACLGVAVDIIEPCGFVADDRRLGRAAMDYARRAEITRHRSWQAFLDGRGEGRLVLLTTHAEASLDRFAFRTDDTLILGRESAGAPADVHRAADGRVRIPMAAGARALNVATAAAMALAEALRQTDAYPRTDRREEIHP
jgi:tRNA (cytidine/uridine-2'-O-)-methyltransferase